MPDVLVDHPAATVIALADTHNIPLEIDKGYARTSGIRFCLKGFPGDRYEYIRTYTIGCDGDDATKVWAFGNGAMLTFETRAKEVWVGIELDQIIRIEGKQFKIEAAPNHNIKLTPA